MKKTISIILLIILVLAMPLTCYAELYVLDPVTGGVLSSDDPNSGVKASLIRVTSNVNYSLKNKMFEYNIGQNSNDIVSSNIFDGEYTTENVTVKANNGDKLVAYKDGEKVLEGFDFNISEPGAYVVRLDRNDSVIFSFVLLKEHISDLYRIDLPSVISLSNIKIDGKSVYIPDLRKIDLDEEGEYDVSLINLCDNSVKSMHFFIDHTAPVLEINGVVDGEAHGYVSFGETEPNSTLEVYLNDVLINQEAKYGEHGDYHVIYKDLAGNTSEYTFKIHMFLDVNTWIYIAVILAIIIAAGVFMIYKRKNLRIA